MNKFKRLLKCLPELVKIAEQMMKDGKIDPPERKALAMEAVKIIAAEWKFKLNFITRFIISKIINIISKKLTPKDIKIPDIVFKIVKEW